MPLRRNIKLGSAPRIRIPRQLEKNGITSSVITSAPIPMLDSWLPVRTSQKHGQSVLWGWDSCALRRSTARGPNRMLVSSAANKSFSLFGKAPTSSTAKRRDGTIITIEPIPKTVAFPSNLFMNLTQAGSFMPPPDRVSPNLSRVATPWLIRTCYSWPKLRSSIQHFRLTRRTTPDRCFTNFAERIPDATCNLFTKAWASKWNSSLANKAIPS